VLFATGGTAGELVPGAGVGVEDNLAVAIDPDGAIVAMRQTGSSVFEEMMGVAADDARVFVVGQTGGWLDDDPGANRGSTDAFLAVLDRDLAVNPSGCIVQLGTGGKDVGQAVAVDAEGVYIAGWTEGVMNGELADGATCNQAGEFPADAFVARYDRACNHVWTRQFGTPAGDVAEAVAIDETHVWVAGDFGGGLDHQDTRAETGGFLRVYDKATGALAGEVLFETDETDVARAVATGATNVYVAGGTGGDLGGPGAGLGGMDMFLATIPKAAVLGNVNANGSGCSTFPKSP
jgi:hypothetical protein